MSIHATRRLVLPSTLPLPICEVPVRWDQGCTPCGCAQRIDICVPQGARRAFHLVDLPTITYEFASEITFDIWESRTGVAAALFSVSLTGSGITLINDYTARFIMEESDTQALSRSTKWCEAWATNRDGSVSIMGAGTFRIFDTRKYD